MIFQPNFGGITPNRLFLTPRGKLNPHSMRLSHIGKRFHAKFYVNQRLRNMNLIANI